MYEKERKEGDSRERERDNRNLMRKRKERERSLFNEKKKFILINKECGNLKIYSNEKRRKGKEKRKGRKYSLSKSIQRGKKGRGRGIIKENLF